MKTILFREKTRFSWWQRIKKRKCTQNFSSVAQKIETLQVFYSYILGNIKNTRQGTVLTGQPVIVWVELNWHKGEVSLAKTKRNKVKTLQ